METQIQKLRTLLRKQNPTTAGEDGEMHAQRWLQANRWIFEPVEQGRATLSKELREHGGKRPDFIAENKTGDEIILLDAKYRNTDNCKIFWLTVSELNQYRALKSFTEIHHTIGEVLVLFMVFPKEHDGKKLVWVDLSEFDNAPDYNGWYSEPAKFVSLTDRDDLWYDNP